MGTGQTGMDDAVDRLRLARTEGVGPVAYRRLIARYGTAALALAALPELARAGGRASPPAIPSADSAAAEIEANARLGARLLFLGTADYPAWLELLTDPPPVLAVLGRLDHLARPAVAIVGSRNASANGRRFAETLARDLAAAGFVVVSGLARGIDGAAHLGALAAGSTIACVAGGLDRPYPAGARAACMARIARDGARDGRGAARHRPAGAALPAPQPRDRRAGPGRRGGRGGAALRQPHHRPAGPGSRARSVRRARIAAGRALHRAPTACSARAPT